MPNIYYVRHGEAETNLDNTFMDDWDSPLTSKGCLQAADTALSLRQARVQFDAVYCSPYKRAQETCHIITQNAFCDQSEKIITDERLRERGFTGLYGKLISQEHWVELWDYESRMAKYDKIELLTEMDDRANDFLSDLKRKYAKHDKGKSGGLANILIVAHAGIGLVLRAAIEGRPANNHLFSYHMLENGEYIRYQI